MTQPQVIPGNSEPDDPSSAGSAEAPPGAAGNGAASPHAGAGGRAGRTAAARLVWPAGFVAAAVVLFAVYLRLSRATPVTADFASVALMAQDMLHGNLLLHGWNITDVTFYTTELPQFMAIEYIRGFGPDVVHVAAAMTYMLVLLLAALLAKGEATGRQALARVLAAAGIMLAPQLQQGAIIVLLSPDHFGTQVPLLLVWLLIDRAQRRWYVPVLAGLILAIVQVGDRIAVTIAVVPLVVVCGLRAYRSVVQRSEPLRSQWFELSLAAAAIVSVAAASAVSRLISAHGGYTQMPLHTTFAAIPTMPSHFWLTVEGILGVYGADFFDHTLGINSALAVLHLAGVAVAGWGFWLAIRRFTHQSLVVQILATAIIVNLAAYMFSVLPGTYWGTRQISAVLPLGAALAGRLAAGRIVRAKLAPAMAVVLLGYVLALGHGLAQPVQPAWSQDLANWLEAHHLHGGFAEYPQANTTTLDSGGRVQVRTLRWPNDVPTHSHYQSDVSWYDPRLHDARFVVATIEPGGGPSPIYSQSRIAFGPPARTYHYRSYIIMTWRTNLMTYVH
ncbi:MAG TPA: hypothetical protein VGN41_10310 [Streptosporangiaceae bacterium]